VLEQRGARMAEPAPECPEINGIKGEIAAGRVRGDATLVEAARGCRASLTADLDGYTSAESAEDLDDRRKLLGIEQWTLLGLSYGTRLALTCVRRHPASIRSVVLDSVRRASSARNRAAQRPPRLTRHSAEAISGRRDAVTLAIP